MTRRELLVVVLGIAVVAGVLAGAPGGGGQGGRAYAATAPEPRAFSTTSPTPTTTATASTTATPTTRPCNVVPRPFAPRTITIKGVTRRAKIVTPPRLAGGVPGPPPLTTAGKEMFAWDKASRIKPGSPRGNVRLNAHTWPDGSAVGNRMLRRLQVGDRIVVYGKSLLLCYRVVKRVQVLPTQVRRYYDRYGKPRLAIVVCSGKRLGPGVWTHRTIWYAKPGL